MKKTIISKDEWQRWCLDNWRSQMALDFETTSLRYTEMELVGASFYNGEDSCYVPAAFLDLSFDDGQELIFHHAPFDMGCLLKFFGIKDGFVPTCTLTGAKLVDEGRMGKKPYSLKTLAHDWLCIEERDIMTWEEIGEYPDTALFSDYAQNDAIWTWDLWQYEKKILKKEGSLYLFTEVETPFQFVLRDLQTNGVLVDVKKLGRFQLEIAVKLNEVEDKIFDLFDLKATESINLFGDVERWVPINLNSTAQLVGLIQNRLHFGIAYTKKKNPSVGVEYLQDMKDKHPFFSLMLRYRKLQKMLSAFIEPCPGFIESDGRIRSSYQMVRSGRLSSSRPNLTQLPNPKREKLDVNYREIYIPAEGNVFVKADYSGQELRNLAEVSRDKNMIEAFNKCFDLHLMTANSIFKLGIEKEVMCEKHCKYDETKSKYAQERYKAKNGANFPIVYGTSEFGISKRQGVTVAEAKKWIRGFFRLYPSVEAAIKKTEEELIENGFVATLMGRRRRYPDFSSLNKWNRAAELRSAFNHKIQGFSADQCKIAAGKVYHILSEYGAKIVLWVHDEIVLECPKSTAEALSRHVKILMEQAVCISVPVVVECEIVNNFGE